MRRCTGCAAPLPAQGNVCRYCGVRNDVDLHGHFAYTSVDVTTGRVCPQCQIALHSVRLSSPLELTLDHCPQCFGLFFDRGEIDVLLEHAANAPATIDRMLLDAIARERYRTPSNIRYLPCPVCGILMNRVNYGQRSGVVVDVCKTHGLWLDNGELTQLLEWKRAGGQLLDQQRQATQARRRHSNANRLSTANADTLTGAEWGDVVEGIFSTLAEYLFR